MIAERQAMRLVIVSAAVAAAMMSTAAPVYAGGFADAQGPAVPFCTGTAPAPHAPNAFDVRRTDPPIPQRRALPRRGRRARNLSTLSAHGPGTPIPIVNVSRTFTAATSPVSDHDRSDDDGDDAPPDGAPTHDRSDDRDFAAGRSDQDADNSLDENDDDDADGVIVISTRLTSTSCEPMSRSGVRPVVTPAVHVCIDLPRRC